MALYREILIEPHPTLRKQADTVKREDISSPAIQGLIKKMAEVLVTSENGVGLAAPQIGESLRIFLALTKKSIANKEEEAKTKIKLPKKNPLEEVGVYINPEIKKQSKNKIILDEGCLSVPGVYGKIRRFEKVTVRALNEHGKEFERGASGLLAQIIQHEIDHLNGILFIDSAKDLQEYNSNENQE